MIYQSNDEGGFSISSRRVWMPGLYATRKAAMYAFQFDEVTLARLSKEICSVRTGNRLITTEDLRAARAELVKG